MLAEEEVEKLLRAGKIVRAVREKVPGWVSGGSRVLDICEAVEGEIRRLGGEPAFPCNVGIDSIGAHYTSPAGDTTSVPEGSLVKVDLGAHIDGYIADSAVTVSVGSEHEDMIRVAEDALERSLQAVAVGGRVSDLGAVTERAIRSSGYQPIRNLTGHQISRYIVHAGVSVPNVNGLQTLAARFQPWSVYALEPFVTLPDAAGEVDEGPMGNIIHVVRIKKVKNPPAKRLFSEINSRYRTLPFTARWLGDVRGALAALEDERIVMGYPVLVEASGKPIAQAEHTILTTDRDVIVTT